MKTQQLFLLLAFFAFGTLNAQTCEPGLEQIPPIGANDHMNFAVWAGQGNQIYANQETHPGTGLLTGVRYVRCGFDERNLKVCVYDMNLQLIDETDAFLSPFEPASPVDTLAVLGLSTPIIVPSSYYVGLKFAGTGTWGVRKFDDAEGTRLRIGNGFNLPFHPDLSVMGGLVIEDGLYAIWGIVEQCVTEVAVPGCTNSSACNFNIDATEDDGSCTFGCNATELMPMIWPACSTTTGNFSGSPVWYSFVAATSGLRVEVEEDALVTLRDASESVLQTETKILNTGDLVPGETYYLSLELPENGPFSWCVQTLPDTRPDLNAGVTEFTRSLCQTAKADWVTGASNYIFHFTQVGQEDVITYETGAAFTLAFLGNVPGLLWGESYEVRIDMDIPLLDASETVEVVRVIGYQTAIMHLTEPPLAELREVNTLSVAGPLPFGAYVAATPWICTTLEWEWEFANTDGTQLTFTYLSGGPSRFIRLLNVPGLQAGAVYNVRVRPVFPSGYEASWGPVQQLGIIGPAGLVVQDSPIQEEDVWEEYTTAVEEPTHTKHGTTVRMYPNPVSSGGVIVLESQHDPLNLVQVFDGRGRMVFQREAMSLVRVEIPAPLESGHYIVVAIDERGVTTSRLVVMH